MGALKVYRTLVVLAEYRGGGERWGKNGGDKSGKSTTYIYIYTHVIIVEYRNKLNMFGNCRDQVWLASVVVYLFR